MTKLDLDHLQGWIGRQETTDDLIDPRRVAQMAGTLGREQVPAPGDVLPPAWHWLFFTPVPEVDGTGVDGHPNRGGFLPPVPLPRRMWAGSTVKQPGVLRVGESATRTSTVAAVEAKSGRGGQLLFVTVEHRLLGGDGRIAVEEQQNIVYREPAPTAEKPVAAAAADDRDIPAIPFQWEVPLLTDPVLLFRYSALTFNAHRIHYDQDYAVREEGYPSLVVHGPLIASLLLHHAETALPDLRLDAYAFRARRPIFLGDAATVCGARDGDQLILWALTPERSLAMRLDATISSS